MIVRLLICNITLFLAFSAFAKKEEDKKLWELGLGAAVLEAPDYPAAEQSRVRIFGLPYVVYRGESIRAGEGGSIVSGYFVENPNWEIDVSFMGAFPSDSSDNDAREDMDDLDWIGQVGPQVIYHFLPGNKRFEFDFALPIRGIVTTPNFIETTGRGVLFNPQVEFVYRSPRNPKTRLFLQVGAQWTSSELADYFYTVDSKDVTPTREAYKAKSGFLGMEYSGAIYTNIQENLSFFSGVQVQTYSGSANEDSPLFRSKSNVSFGMGLIWVFMESETPAYSRL